ncbi:hypothetical protein LVJ85_05840 [Neisseria sp. Dent CA1/247]|uniref:hypothetical protein n=1 Tax=Neisseria sp. Dent CA1/247 TaxID=2912675 RepID=UPI001FD35219|nr:hypothetical protein [Neisseria sp. Dent CA1/247]UOO77982.1 hypothetical protein LVJ85_05840 [Neisseria sp. Dent CA1/247]
MNNPRYNPKSEPQNGEDEFDWESGLEKLRQQRNTGRENPAPARPAPQPAAPAYQPASSKPTEAQLSARAAEKMLREYLQQWQEEHNELFTENITAETDTTVLLQEDWVAAQTALQTARVDDKNIESTRTVWLNPKRQTVSFNEPENLRQTGRSDDNADEQSDNAFESVVPHEDWLPVTVKVINPQVDPRKPVMCLSEQELLERLSRRLRPHLTDAVAGMVRVAVQKQTAALTYQLQQLLNEQTPALVDEILDYNLKAAMSEIKYSLKYKR